MNINILCSAVLSGLAHFPITEHKKTKCASKRVADDGFQTLRT